MPITIGLLLLAVFIWRQILLQRTDSALLDLRTFTSRNFTLSIALLATAMLALFGTIIVLPQFARYTLGLETFAVGAMLLPGGLLMGLLGPTVGRLFDRVRPSPAHHPRRGRRLDRALDHGVRAGRGLLVARPASSRTPSCGLGLAFLFTPLFSTSLGSLPPKLYSYGSATVATLQQVAGAAGIAIFVALYATGLAAAGNLDPEHPSAAEAANGSHLAFVAGGIISLAVILVSVFITKPPVADGHGGEWATEAAADADAVSA